jgi:hypothetical protein
MKVEDVDNFEEMLEDAERQAIKAWDIGFVAGMRERYDNWGENLEISIKQIEQLERIAGY